MSVLSRTDARRQRHSRIRKKLRGTADRPRMALSISLKRMCVQFVDDVQGRTLVSSFTRQEQDGKNMETARALGRQAGELLVAQGISSVVVDRGGFRYHGRVQAIVEGAMASGVKVGRATLPPEQEAVVESEESKAAPADNNERKEKK